MKLNNLVKRVIGAVAAVFGLLFLVAGKNLKMVIKAAGESDSGKLKVFDFLKDAKDAEIFGFQRVLFWVAIIVIFAALAWFVFAVVAELVKNEKLTKIANKFSKWAAVALVGAVLLVVVAGLIPHTEKVFGFKMKYTASALSSIWFYLTAVCAVGSAVVEFKA